jgi:hypothetical protein
VPDTISFQAQIRVKYTRALLDSAGITNETLIRLYRYNSSDSTWQELPTTVDTLANVATATTTRFSTWSLTEVQPSAVTETHTPSVPGTFSLEQNRPNPFNPTTQIRFAIPATGHVKLVVYNILGQAVETLVDGVRAAGTYTVTWDARNVATGIYFYRLEASVDGRNTRVETRKMTLLK